jgi:hypothetical protein
MANGHGGARAGGGRKPKAEEDKIKKLSTNAIIKIYGSEQAFFEKLAEMAMSEFPALKLLMEYTYGKPKEQKEASQEFVKPILEHGKELPPDE